MAIDAITAAAALTGLATGGIAVVAHTGAHYLDGSLQKSRERTLLAIFFAFFSGFLLPFFWIFMGPSLVQSLAFAAPAAGFLWGGFLWVAFVLPTEIAHVVWERQDPRTATVGLAAWLSTLLIGGAVCGAVLPPPFL